MIVDTHARSGGSPPPALITPGRDARTRTSYQHGNHAILKFTLLSNSSPYFFLTLFILKQKAEIFNILSSVAYICYISLLLSTWSGPLTVCARCTNNDGTRGVGVPRTAQATGHAHSAHSPLSPPSRLRSASGTLRPSATRTDLIYLHDVPYLPEPSTHHRVWRLEWKLKRRRRLCRVATHALFKGVVIGLGRVGSRTSCGSRDAQHVGAASSTDPFGCAF